MFVVHASAQEVVISELMAAGQEVLADGDGDFPDWIELRNTSTKAVNLNGWHLTDNDSEPKKWAFPSVSIAPGGYLVVFASGKNRRAAGSELHTSFSLAADGEYLALTRPDGTPASVLPFPAQLPGVSFGAGPHYFTTPTPKAENSTAYAAVASAPVFSKRHGFINSPFTLTLTSSTPGAIIRYTLDGSAPSPTHGEEYTGPLSIANTSVVRAASFKAESLSSPVVTRTYIFLNDVVQQSPDGSAPRGWPSTWGAYNGNYGLDPRIVNSPEYGPSFKNDLKSIPSISLVMDLPDLFDPERGIYTNSNERGDEWERPGSIELLDPDGNDSGFQINAGVRIRGGASRTESNPKHAFHILARGRYGAAELDYPLFGPDGAKSTARFDLRCDQIASWHFTRDKNSDFIRDQFSRDNQLALGQPSGRGDFYHLYINGQYWGLFNTQERIRANYGQRYFGGKESDYDVVGLENTAGTAVKDGTFDSWTRLFNAARQGFGGNAAYMKVQGLNPDGTRNSAYEQLLDVDNLIVYMMAGIYQGINDAPFSGGTQNNWFAMKSRRGDFGWRFFMHDSELSMYNVDDQLLQAEPAEQPLKDIRVTDSNPWHIWEALRKNPEFRLRVADHVHRAFFNNGPLTATSASARFLARAREIDRAVVGESARWGDAGGGWGMLAEANGLVIDPPPGADNANGAIGDPLTREDWVKATYERELRDYLPGRSEVVLQQFKNAHLYPATAAPEFSQFGGAFQPGFTLTITNPGGAGVIYYTLDGTDPRRLGGAVAAGARPYSTPVPLTARTIVQARTKNGAEWSALVSAEFAPAQDLSGLQITEIHYHPANANVGGVDIPGDDQEFVELKNAGTTPLDISGYRFIAGITYTFPANTTLAPGAFWVLARNASAFAQIHSAAADDVYTGKLDDGGETLTLATAAGAPVLSVTYKDASPWPITADGLGFSLVRANDGSPDEPTSWRASANISGSPGTNDPDPHIPHVVVNEILASATPGEDKIELCNLEPLIGQPDLWWLTDDPQQPKKYRLHSAPLVRGQVIIGEPTYLVLNEADFGAAFSLNPTGGGLWLFSADVDGNLTGYVHGFKYGASEAGVSFGRHINGVGEEQLVAQSATTFGTANSGPRLGEVVINEIQYQPAIGDDEFIELRNTTDAAIAIAGWQFEGLAFLFPAAASIPANGLALIVPIDPETFRTKYHVAAEVPIFGPATGVLQNSGERLTLSKPGPHGQFIAVDSVRYNDHAPWPPAAAGSGPSLHRYVTAMHGDDPTKWFTSGASPGSASVFNFSPSVAISSPENGAVFTQPVDLVFTATASDTDGTVQTVQYFADGLPLGTASAPDFAFTWKKAAAGSHEITARAFDDGGAVSDSNPIVVTIQLPPPATGSGLLGEYFDNTELSGDPVVTRIDAPIDFEWTDQGPAPGLPVKGYSVRWTGQLQPRRAGDASFEINASGGVRLWIDDELILDAWDSENNMPQQSHYVNATFEAWRTYTLRLEYRDSGGLAGVRLAMGSNFGSPVIIPESQLFLPGQNPLGVGITTAAHLPSARVRTPFQTQLGAARGVAPYMWSGELPQGLSLSANGVLSGTPTALGTLEFRVRVTDASGDFAEKVLSLEVLTPPGARPLPTVTISTPYERARVPEGNVEFRGRAQHSRGIVGIRYSLNGGPWRAAVGRESWNILLDSARGLFPGQNTIRVRAYAPGGLSSAEKVLNFYMIAYRPLAVDYEGEGTITAGFLGSTVREVGRSYTITATPAPGWVFAGWSGSQYGERSTLRFTMTEGASLHARFVPNSFAARAGTFTALLSPEEIVFPGDPADDTIKGSSTELSHEGRGIITLTVTRTGTFTGTMRVGSERYRLKGRFNADGFYSVVLGGGPRPRDIRDIIPLPGGRYMTLSYSFGDNDHIQCSSNSPIVFENSTGTAERSSYGQGKPACPWRGSYTVTIGAGEPPAPQGEGHATLRIDRKGRATITGTLADGALWSTSALMTDSGHLPLNALLYSNTGSISGELSFKSDNGLTGSGDLFWSRPAANPGDPFPDGFATMVRADAQLDAVSKKSGPVQPLSIAVEK
ncbi:lamin tail domain-containing protein [Verrucomicrobiota bacterium sgz303538]